MWMACSAIGRSPIGTAKLMTIGLATPTIAPLIGLNAGGRNGAVPVNGSGFCPATGATTGGGGAANGSTGPGGAASGSTGPGGAAGGLAGAGGGAASGSGGGGPGSNAGSASADGVAVTSAATTPHAQNIEVNARLVRCDLGAVPMAPAAASIPTSIPLRQSSLAQRAGSPTADTLCHDRACPCPDGAELRVCSDARDPET